MAVEVQSILFSASIQDRPDGGFDFFGAPTTAIRADPFPVTPELQFIMLLRKDAADQMDDVTVEMSIRDQAGQLAYGPNGLLAAFGGSHRFAVVKGIIHPTFPAPSQYAVAVTVTSGAHAATYRYDIDVLGP